MRLGRRYKSANDNAPLRRNHGHTQVKLQRRIAHARTAQAIHSQALIETEVSKASDTAFKASPEAYNCVQYMPQNKSFQLDLGNKVIREMILLMALFTGILGAVSLTHFLDMTATRPSILLGASVGALFMSMLFRSTPTLLLSLVLNALWLGLSFMDLPEFQNLSSPYLMVFIPLLLAGQLIAAMQMKKLRSIAITVTLTALWLVLLCYQANLSSSAIGSAVFMFGASQHRLGKTALDNEQLGAHWHILFGWLIAIIGLAYVQQVWLDPNIELFQNHSTVANTPLWMCIIAMCAAAILYSSLKRLKNNKISIFGLVAVSTITGLVPLSVYQPQWIEIAFTTFFGFKSSPTFGIIIGTAVLASAIGIITSGLLRGRLTYVITGVMIFGLQAIILAGLVFSNLEVAIITLLSLIVALAIGGSVAGQSLAQSSAA